MQGVVGAGGDLWLPDYIPLQLKVPKTDAGITSHLLPVLVILIASPHCESFFINAEALYFLEPQISMALRCQYGTSKLRITSRRNYG